MSEVLAKQLYELCKGSLNKNPSSDGMLGAGCFRPFTSDCLLLFGRRRDGTMPVSALSMGAFESTIRAFVPETLG